MLPEAIGAAETPSHLPIADATGPLLSPRGEEKRHAVAKCDSPALKGGGADRAASRKGRLQPVILPLGLSRFRRRAPAEIDARRASLGTLVGFLPLALII